jgi:hypothetical protein
VARDRASHAGAYNLLTEGSPSANMRGGGRGGERGGGARLWIFDVFIIFSPDLKKKRILCGVFLFCFFHGFPKILHSKSIMGIYRYQITSYIQIVSSILSIFCTIYAVLYMFRPLAPLGCFSEQVLKNQSSKDRHS